MFLLLIFLKGYLCCYSMILEKIVLELNNLYYLLLLDSSIYKCKYICIIW